MCGNLVKKKMTSRLRPRNHLTEQVSSSHARRGNERRVLETAGMNPKSPPTTVRQLLEPCLDRVAGERGAAAIWRLWADAVGPRSEEHTSELQSQFHLVCRLLLEKKKKKKKHDHPSKTKKKIQINP